MTDSIEFLPVIECALDVARRNMPVDQKDADQFTAFCVWQELRRAGWTISRN
jgi:hypothetical protein